jgi:hypothetical protein
LRAIEVEADHLFGERTPRDSERVEDCSDVAAVFRQGGSDQRAFTGRDAGGEGAVSVEDAAGSVENLGYGPAGNGEAQRKPFGDRLQLPGLQAGRPPSGLQACRVCNTDVGKTTAGGAA